MNIYGVIGWPIKHSLSPAMHNAAFKALGIKAEYRAFEVKPEELEDFILNRRDVVGFNITVPHKIAAMEIIKESGKLIHRQVDLDYIEFSGAINTVKRDGDNFLCANTDVAGFKQSLRDDLEFNYADKNVLVIGCGGAGRAVISGLTSGDNVCNKIYICDNNMKTLDSAKIFYHGKACLCKLEFISEKNLSEVIKDCQLLVNATPVGMKERDASPIDKQLFHKDLYVYDVVYNRETQLVKDARSLFGKEHAVGGLGMLLYQGAESFKLWTGKNPPVEVIRNALNKALSLQLKA